MTGRLFAVAAGVIAAVGWSEFGRSSLFFTVPLIALVVVLGEIRLNPERLPR